MKCPHCQAELRYRERSNRTCSKCRQPFALEPRANGFKLHDLGLRDLLNRLSHNGTIRITSEQVLGALLRRRQAKKSGFPCGLYILATIVAAFLFGIINTALNIPTFFIIIPVIFAWIITGYLVSRASHSRRLPSLSNFEETILRPWNLKYGRPPWLIMNDEAIALSMIQPPIHPNSVNMVILCPSAAVRAFIVANALPQRFGMIALPPVINAAQEPWLRAVRERRAPVWVLHEASFNGCLLVRDVYQLWQLPVDHPVIDLGINPRDILESKDPLVMKVKSDANLINKVIAFTQLQSSEIDWLKQGHVAPLYGLPPARLLAILMASGKAGQVGFMSWPKSA